jgi:Penicillin binding protein transpeptidase domain
MPSCRPATDHGQLWHQGGNGDIGGGIDQFWLTGALRISAREQIGFLRRLADGTLPFRADHQEATRRILLFEDAPEYHLYARTGWTTRSGQSDIGWYVGWVERMAGAGSSPSTSTCPRRRTRPSDRSWPGGSWPTQAPCPLRSAESPGDRTCPPAASCYVRLRRCFGAVVALPRPPPPPPPLSGFLWNPALRHCSSMERQFDGS